MATEAAVGKSREEILAQPRPDKACSKCGRVSGFWTWIGFKLVECRECGKQHEAQDRIEIARMMRMNRTTIVPKSRVLENDGGSYD